MAAVGTLIVITCVVVICGAWLIPKLRTASLVATTVLVGVAAWMLWWGLLFFQVVRLDSLLRLLNIYRLDSVTRAVVFLGPPLLAAAAFAAIASRWRGRD